MEVISGVGIPSSGTTLAADEIDVCRLIGSGCTIDRIIRDSSEGPDEKAFGDCKSGCVH